MMLLGHRALQVVLALQQGGAKRVASISLFLLLLQGIRTAAVCVAQLPLVLVAVVAVAVVVAAK